MRVANMTRWNGGLGARTWWTIASVALLSTAGCGSLFGSKGSQPEPDSGAALGTLPAGASARLVFERKLAADALEAPSAQLRASVSGANVRSACLRTPDNREIVLEPTADGAAVVVEAADDGELIAQFGRGLYYFDITLDGGGTAAIGVSVRGAFPPFPEAVEPADGATDVGALPVVKFSGIARSFDAHVIDVLSGESILLAENSEIGAASPGKALGTGRTYRLEVSAESGPVGGSYEFESTRTSTFTTVSQ